MQLHRVWTNHVCETLVRINKHLSLLNKTKSSVYISTGYPHAIHEKTSFTLIFIDLSSSPRLEHSNSRAILLYDVKNIEHAGSKLFRFAIDPFGAFYKKSL